MSVGWPKTVLLVALLIAALATIFGGNRITKLKTGGFDDPASESVRGTTALSQRFHTANPNLVVIVEKPGGAADDADTAAVGRDVTAQLQASDGVAVIASYFTDSAADLRSRQGDAGLILAWVAGDEDTSARRVARLHSTLARSSGPVHVRFGGVAQLNNDINQQVTGDLKKAESIAIPVTLVLLLLVFATVVAAGVPLVVGLLAIACTLGALAGIGAVTDVSIFAVNLTTALGLGLAVDYSLLFVSRYREERARLRGFGTAQTVTTIQRAAPTSLQPAIAATVVPAGRTSTGTIYRAGQLAVVSRYVGRAAVPAGPVAALEALGCEPLSPKALSAAALAATMRTAGRTIVFSAATVAAALCCLLVFSQYFLRSFAYAGIAVVGLTMLGALVVLPAMLFLLGNGIDRLALPGRRRLARTDAGVWGRVAAVVLRRPLLTAAPVILLLVALGLPFLNVQFGVPDERVLQHSVESRQVADRLRGDFATPPVGSLVAVAEQWGSDSDAERRTAEYATALSQVPGVYRVDSGAGSYVDGQLVVPPTAATSARFRSGDAIWLSVLSRVEPYSEAGGDLARAVRKVPVPGDRTVLVTGQAAQLIDITESIGNRLPLAIGLIVLTTLVLLFLLTGSVILPVKALALNALTLVGVFGAMVWVFQEGHLSGLLGFTPTPIAVAIPVLLFCVTFGLSMDYEVFVLARIGERHEAGADLKTAVTEGLSRSGRIISAAAAILSASFLAMVVSGVSFIQLFGLGASLAILIDALITRPVLVPAFMRLAGRWNWWSPAPLRALHARIGLREGPRGADDTPALDERYPDGRAAADQPAQPVVADPANAIMHRANAVVSAAALTLADEVAVERAPVTVAPSAPRRLDLIGFEALRTLADRAPSAHNTQPWMVTPSLAMEIGWDTRWALGPSDPTGRDQRLSLGAFIETCLVLAASEGLAAEFVPGYDAAQRRVGYLVGSATSYPTPFTPADVQTRRTWRGAWLPETVDPRLLAWLSEVARVGGARLVHVSCADVRELLFEASRWFFDNPEIVAELRAWARLTPGHPHYDHDGLRDTALGLGAVDAAGLRAAIHPSVQMFGRLLHLPALLAAAQAQSFDGPGSLLVLLAPAETGPAGEVDIGRTMLRMWLGLTRYGLAAHPHSHLIDCPDTADRLAQLAGAANERLVWVARVGRPNYEAAGNVPMSARRTGAAANGGNGSAGGLELLPGAGTGLPLGDLLGRYVPQ